MDLLVSFLELRAEKIFYISLFVLARRNPGAFQLFCFQVAVRVPFLSLIFIRRNSLAMLQSTVVDQYSKYFLLIDKAFYGSTNTDNTHHR